MGDGSRPNSKGKGRAIHDGDVLALDLDSAEEGSTHGGNAFMQMQQIEQQVTFNLVSCNSISSYAPSRTRTSNRDRRP
jgi:hypothetical protein